MTQQDDKRQRSTQSDTPFYDINFDIAPDVEEADSHSNPSKHPAKSTASRWDHVYEDYVHNKRPVNSDDLLSPTTTQAKQSASQISSEDIWHYQPDTEEKTVMEQSSEILDRSMKRVKDFLHHFTPRIDEANPYKSANQLADQDFQPQLFQQKDPLEKAAHQTKIKGALPKRDEAVSTQIPASILKKEATRTLNSERIIPTSPADTKNSTVGSPTPDSIVPTDSVPISTTPPTQVSPQEGNQHPVQNLTRSQVGSSSTPLPSNLEHTRLENSNPTLKATVSQAEIQPQRAYSPLDSDLLSQANASESGTTRNSVPIQSFQMEEETSSIPIHPKPAAPTASNHTHEKDMPSLSERGRARLSSLLSILEDIPTIPIPTHLAEAKDHSNEDKPTEKIEPEVILMQENLDEISNASVRSHSPIMPSSDTSTISATKPTASIEYPQRTTSMTEEEGIDLANQKLRPATTPSPEISPTELSRNLEKDSQPSFNLDPDYFDQATTPPSDQQITVTQEEQDSSPKHKKKTSAIDLSNYSTKEKIFFGLNVTINVIRRIVLFLLLFGLLLGSFAAGSGLGYFAYLVSDTQPPSREEMAARINQLEQQSTIYYANGEPIANVRADVIRSVTELSDVSPNIINGLVSTEDATFYEHRGVVPKAILRATLQELLSPGSGTGGSTLTQQLVKQRLLTNDVTFFRKANEILFALRLEEFFTKDEILTAYLNVSPFGRDHNGDNVAGIEKASEGIFGKKPSEVNLAQAAFLVGLPQDPYSYTPYQQNGELKSDLSSGIERMKDVLYFMYRNQKISEADYQAALNYDIRADFLPAGRPSIQRQSYLYQAMERGAIEQIMRLNIERDRLTWNQVYQDDNWYNQYYQAAEEQLKTGGYRVYTTIDRQIYDLLQASAQKYIDQLGVTYDGVYTDPETGQETYYIEKVQNGMVVMDNRSGKVLGFIAGTDFENNQIDHAFNMRRSPGSTIKPLAVYGPAIQEDIIQPSTVIPDTVFTQTFEDGTSWSPTNYGNVVSGGAESARVALYKSDNLPAVRVYQEMQNRSVDVMSYLEKMGFNPNASYTQEDVSNLAFAIGGVSSGPTVLEETRAFATFANNGQYRDGYFIDRIEDAAGNIVYQHQENPTTVFSEDSNYLMVDMLRNTMTEGTGRIARSYMNMGGDWIAKSGISENSKDVWFIASTPSITIGSWIGYDSRFQNYTINIEDGYGRESERSQRYWASVVNDLYAARPDIFGVDQQFNRPANVEDTDVLQQTGTRPGSLRLENGGTIALTGPTYKDVFKASNPARDLNYRFLFGATDEELSSFWASFRAQLEEQRRQEELRRQQESSSNSSSSSSSNNGNQDNNQNTSTDETQGNN